MVASVRELLIGITLLQAVAFGEQASNQTLNATTLSSPDENKELQDDYYGKDEYFVECPKFVLDPDEYVKHSNGSIYVPVYNRTYTEEFYMLDDDILTVCIPEGNGMGTHDPTHTLASNELYLLSVIGMGVSMVCLLIHIFQFALVPDLQNLPGYNMASMCTALLLSYVLMIVALSKKVHYNIVACITAAALMEFFLMSTFMWMFVIAIDVSRSIRQATSNLRASSKGFHVKRYICYNLMAWGTSLLFTATALVADNVDFVPKPFKPQFDEFCWFKTKESLLIFFLGPMIVLTCINFILFGISSFNIFSNRMRSSQDSRQSNLRRNHWMYFKLAIIMGVTWIVGAVAPAMDKVWLWYLFTALNAFQGFFIFLAFTCSGKSRTQVKNKLFEERLPKKSLPTFQSFGLFSSSSEEGMNKIAADNKL